MQHDFRVRHFEAAFDAQELDEVVGDDGGFEALDFAAVVADEMGVFVLVFLFGRADGVQPAAIVGADFVDDAFFLEGAEGAVDGDGVDALEFTKNLRDRHRSSSLGEDLDNADSDGGPTETGRA